MKAIRQYFVELFVFQYLQRELEIFVSFQLSVKFTFYMNAGSEMKNEHVRGRLLLTCTIFEEPCSLKLNILSLQISKHLLKNVLIKVF